MKKKILILLSTILVLLLGTVGAYGYHMYKAAEMTANKIYKPLKSDMEGAKKAATSTLSTQIKKKTMHKPEEPISILLLGVDQRKNDPGRSDTMIVLTLNPQTQEMQMISIPRDTRTELGENGIVTKINAAYAYGGPDLAVQTVDQFLNIKLDYYVRINMQGLKSLVDSLGGITVNNKLAWHDEGYYKKGFYYKKGIIHLNGPQALGYVRMRHLDPLGDFGRNRRQRKVIQAIVNKAAHFSSLNKYQSILNTIQNNVQTNLTFDDMKNIITNYRSAKKHVKTYEVQGQGEIIDKLWYLVVNDAERQKVSKMINDQLKTAEPSHVAAEAN